MKKNYKCTIALITMIFLVLSILPVQATENTIQNTDQEIKVLLNGKEIQFEQPPIIINSRTLVPMRAIFEALGAKVTWDDTTKYASGIRNSVSVRIRAGDSKAQINKKLVTLDQSAVIINGRILVPIRFVSESLGSTVDWNESTKTVVISDTQSVIPDDTQQKSQVYYDLYTLFMNDDFSDGDITSNSSWEKLNGSAELFNDSENRAMKFTSDLTRYSAPVLTAIPTNGKLTIKYRIRKTEDSNVGGLYLVDDSGVGYGFVADMDDQLSRTELRFEKTPDFGNTSALISTSSLNETPKNDWHTVVVLWDIEAKTFTSYLDGTKVGETVTDASYSTFTKVVAYGKTGETELIDDIKINTTPDSAVTALSWWTPIGRLTGRETWGGNGTGYRYMQLINKEQVTLADMDYIVPPKGFEMPENAPVIGSDEYYDLYYRAALGYDLPDMKAAGFNVLAFDIQTDPKYDPKLPITSGNAPLTHYKTMLTLMKAAEQLGGIKVGPFVEGGGATSDFPNGYTNSKADWVKFIKAALDNLPNSNAVWKVKNKPVIIMFGNVYRLKDTGITPYYGWGDVVNELRKTNTFYFIPDVNPFLENYGKYSEIADAAYAFVPAAPLSYLKGTKATDQVGMFNTFTTQTEYPKIPFYLGSTPGYYRRGGYTYEQFDFERIHEAYMAAINSNASGMMAQTWNDFEEDTQIAPTARNGRSLVDIYSYYNTWLKTGVQPSADEENVTISYPVNIPSVIKTKTLSWGYGAEGEEKGNPDFLKSTNPNKGRVFYWANLKTPQTLKINDFKSINLPAGLSYGEIDEGVLSGKFTASITANGKTQEFNDLPWIKQIKTESDDGRMCFRNVRLK